MIIAAASIEMITVVLDTFCICFYCSAISAPLYNGVWTTVFNALDINAIMPYT